MYGNSYEKHEHGGWSSQAPQQPQYGGYQPGPYGQQPYQQPSYGAPGQAPHYGAPGAPPPQPSYNNYGPPPPQENYGATSQYGGHGGSPPPPPNGYPSYGQPQQQQYQQPPQHQYQQPPPQHQYQQSPPPPQQPQQSAGQPVTFRFSHSGGKDGILNSTVTDTWGRPVFSIQSSKKETNVLDQEKRPLAIFDWSHSSPNMDYAGRRLKVKEWMPIDKSHKVRSVNHQGVTYDWVETGPGAITLSAKGSQPIATYYNSNNQVSVEIQPEGLRNGIVEVAVLGVFLMCSGKPFGDVKESSSSLPIIFGGFLGTMIA